MSLQELQNEIERKAEEESTRILAAAKQEAQNIIAEATSKAASLNATRANALDMKLVAREKAELAITRMDRRGDLLRVKYEWTKRVLEEAEKRITKMADDNAQEYHKLLSNLILEGITKLKGHKFTVETNSRDKEAVSKSLETIAERAGKIKNAKVVLQMETLQTRTLGGVVVSTEDKVEYFNNTLEARLSAASRNVEGRVRRTLFGAGETNE